MRDLCKELLVVEDLDKDSDYIYEHHRDFVVDWKDDNYKNFDDDSLRVNFVG